MRRRADQRRRRALLVAGLAAVALGACAPEPERTWPTELPPRDLGMLELMLQLNSPYLAMQSQLRNVDAMEDVSAAAGIIAGIAEDPLFDTWVETSEPARDPGTWRESYADLLEGARDARDAAAAGELERLHAAYGRMSKSCTACHKRYSPHQ